MAIHPLPLGWAPALPSGAFSLFDVMQREGMLVSFKSGNTPLNLENNKTMSPIPKNFFLTKMHLSIFEY
jgi:hypothetical protein